LALFGIVLVIGNALYGILCAAIDISGIFGVKDQYAHELLQAREKGFDQRVSEIKLSREIWLLAFLALTPVTAISTYLAIMRNTQSYFDQNPGNGSGGEWACFGFLSWMAAAGVILRLSLLRSRKKALDAIGPDGLKF
jgi:hypothetical protein